MVVPDFKYQGGPVAGWKYQNMHDNRKTSHTVVMVWYGMVSSGSQRIHGRPEEAQRCV